MRPHAKSIASGLAAIALWSWSFALSRAVVERLGVLTAAAAVCLIAGAAGTVVSLLAGWHRPALARLSRSRIAILCLLFAGYQAAVYGALGTARGRESFLAVTVVNYLWPGLTVAFAIPLLGRPFRWPLVPGLALAFGGVLLGTFAGGGAAAGLAAGLRANLLPYGLALAAAVAWALYSNLVARWAKEAGSGLVPFYFLAAGLALAPFALREPAAAWGGGAVAELLAQALAVTLAGYLAWDHSMRRRESELIPALAHLIPLPSITVSAAYLDIPVGWEIFAAAALVVAGSAICWRAVALPRAGGR